MVDFVRLYFLRSWHSYNRGEVAGFQESAAARILDTQANGEPVARVLEDDEWEKVQRDRERRAAEAVAPEPVPVRFSRTYGRYAPGEVAGFHPKEAKRLVEGERTKSGWRRPCAVYLDQEGDDDGDETESTAEADADSGSEDSEDSETEKPRRRRKKKSKSKKKRS